MALFLDSVDLDAIRGAMELGIYSGVTTNPGLLEGIPPADRLERYGEIARICPKSLYLQVTRTTPKEMEHQALVLAEVAPGRTVIKLPMSADGLRLCQSLQKYRVPVCITAVFTPTQAHAAALAGAHTVAMFIGRITRAGGDGVEALRQANQILRAASCDTRLVAASIPDIETLAAVLTVPGVDVTIPHRLQKPMLSHPGTDEAIADFTKASAGR